MYTDLERINEVALEISRERVRGASWSSEAMAKAILNEANKNTISCKDIDIITKIVTDANPLMGSLYNLSLIMQNACNQGKTLEWATNKFLSYMSWARKSIVEHAAQLFKEEINIFTMSNSSNILDVVARYKEKINKVLVGESQPGGEGAYFATQTKSLGIDVELYPDSAVSSAIEKSNVILIGADNITIDGCLFNKVGAKNVAIIAGYYGKPVISVFEPFKINPIMKCNNEIALTRSYLVEGFGQLTYRLFDELPNNLIDGILSVNGLTDVSQSSLKFLHDSFVSWFNTN